MPVDSVYLNGQWCAAEEAKISPLDRGFLFGDGCYEVIPIYQQQAFYLEAHLQRLNDSLKQLHIRPPEVDFAELVSRLIDTNQAYSKGYVYLHVSRGFEEVRNFYPQTETSATVFAYFEPIHSAASDATTKAYQVQLIEDIRWHRCDIKSTNLLGSVLMRLEARAAGFDDVIFHRNQCLSEGGANNILVRFGDDLVTPKADHNLLAGVTRQAISDVLKKHHKPLIERVIHIDEIAQADEIWLSASIIEIIPVVKVNEQLINGGEIGDYYRWIKPLFQAMPSLRES